MPPIGILDSGAGGLTVLARLVEHMPHQPFVYLADTAFCPYGKRNHREIRARVTALVEFLIAQGCGIVVLACNTATAAAIDDLRSTYPIPFVGMEPAVKPAALHSRAGHIGVLATQGTFQGELFRRAVAQYSTQAKIHYLVGEGLVQIVENQLYDAPETIDHLQDLLTPFLQAGIDHLVLGCTHYPFLRNAFAKVLPESVTLVDPAPAVALQVGRIAHAIAMNLPPSLPPTAPQIEFISTGNPDYLPVLYSYYAGIIRSSAPCSQYSLRTATI